MGNIDPPVQFCEGCPFSNGIEEADILQVRSAGMVAPQPGMEFEFVDSRGQTSSTVKTPPSNGFDSTEVSATGRDIINRIRSCNKPIEETRKRLGGLLGEKTIQVCGAFPKQNPKKPMVKRSSDAWMYMDY